MAKIAYFSGKILPISLKLNFTPNPLDWLKAVFYLKYTNHRNNFVVDVYVCEIFIPIHSNGLSKGETFAVRNVGLQKNLLFDHSEHFIFNFPVIIRDVLFCFQLISRLNSYGIFTDFLFGSVV